jgi:hypothetical protein
MTVDTEGFEEPFRTKIRDVEPASEVIRELQKKLEDVLKERDGLRSQVKILKVTKRGDRRICSHRG